MKAVEEAAAGGEADQEVRVEPERKWRGITARGKQGGQRGACSAIWLARHLLEEMRLTEYGDGSFTFCYYYYDSLVIMHPTSGALLAFKNMELS